MDSTELRTLGIFGFSIAHGIAIWMIASPTTIPEKAALIFYSVLVFLMLGWAEAVTTEIPTNPYRLQEYRRRHRRR